MHLDKNNRKALIGTILFHGLLILALMFLALRTPLPLPGEQGVEVNLGYADQGAGMLAKQIPIAKPIVKKEEKVVQNTPEPKPAPKTAKTKILTQDTEEAPSLVKKKAKPIKPKPKLVKKKIIVVKEKPVEKKAEKPKEKVVKKVIEAPKPVVNQRALFKVPAGEKNQGQGISQGPGDQGKPKGFEKSKSYTGKGGEGHGISYNLGDRGARFLDKPSSSFNEQGTVVVKIWVSPKGGVVDAKVYAKGTTVVDKNLRNMAVRAALNSSFSSDPGAPAEQIGTITYHFILKK